MLLIYIGVYTLILVGIWGLFMIAKIHAYKFKNFSPVIPKITGLLAFFLAGFSILGYVLIFFYSSPSSNSLDIKTSDSSSQINNSLDSFDENYY